MTTDSNNDISVKNSGYITNQKQFIDDHGLIKITMDNDEWKKLNNEKNISEIKIDGKEYTYFDKTLGSPLENPGFFSVDPQSISEQPDVPPVKYQTIADQKYFTDEEKVIEHVEKIEKIDTSEPITFTDGDTVTLDDDQYTYYDKLDGGDLDQAGFFASPPSSKESEPDHNFTDTYLKIVDDDGTSKYFSTIEKLISSRSHILHVDKNVKKLTFGQKDTQKKYFIDGEEYEYINNGSGKFKLLHPGYFTSQPNDIESINKKPDASPLYKVGQDKYFTSWDEVLKSLEAKETESILDSHKKNGQEIEISGRTYTYHTKTKSESLAQEGFYKVQPITKNDVSNKAPQVQFKYNDKYYTNKESLLEFSDIQPNILPTLLPGGKQNEKLNFDGEEYTYFESGFVLSPEVFAEPDVWKISGLPEGDITVTNKSTSEELNQEQIKNNLNIETTKKYWQLKKNSESLF